MPAPHAPAVTTATGLSPRAAACLAYALWWASGALMLALEPAHPFVRFHARQALRAFGLIWLTGVAFWVLSFVLVFVSPVGFRVAAVLGQLTWGAGVLAWAACLVRAWRGERWPIPWLGSRLRLDA
jgi:uncharacterized membrane protein